MRVDYELIKARSVPNETSCSICLKECFTLKRRVYVTQLKCSHLFHSNCLNKWFQNKHNCPMCRNDVNVIEVTKTVTTPSFIVLPPMYRSLVHYDDLYE